MKCLDCGIWMKRITKLEDGSECIPYFHCPKCGVELEESEYWEME